MLIRHAAGLLVEFWPDETYKEMILTRTCLALSWFHFRAPLYVAFCICALIFDSVFNVWEYFISMFWVPTGIIKVFELNWIEWSIWQLAKNFGLPNISVLTVTDVHKLTLQQNMLRSVVSCSSNLQQPTD